MGILRETKPQEFRTPLTPADVAWLKKRSINVEVESSQSRVFDECQYIEAGATIVNRIDNATLLVGVKEPEVQNLLPEKIYMVFSHTIKGLPDNMPILRECISKGITLIDYEKITGSQGERLVYFGRFAGICGAIDSLCYLGRKLKSEGINSPFSMIRPAAEYKTLSRAKKEIKNVAAQVREYGLDARICPFIVGVTGHGNVYAGVKEILGLFTPIEIHPRDMQRFVNTNQDLSKNICMIVFDREEKLRKKDGTGFYFEEYLSHPERCESNMDVYLTHINILLHTSYWDRRCPRLVTKDLIHEIWSRHCRLKFIGDISCDIKGSIEITRKATTANNPTYTYNPRTKRYTDGFKSEGITILARDNLPTELPQDASQDFSLQIREYVYQLAVHGALDVTEHVAIPRELRNAVIVQSHTLTKPYSYLRKSLKDSQTEVHEKLNCEIG